MRAIDADALIEKCGGWYVEEGTESGFIGTLKNLLATEPTIQPEKEQLSCGGTTSDLISRMETVKRLRRMLEATVPNTDYDEGFIDGIEFAISTASTMPPIQPEPKEGKWEQASAQRYFTSASYIYRCSVCGENNPRNTKYCPNCGAKMTTSK